MKEFFTVEPGSVWACAEGKKFLVLGLANEDTEMPVMVIYTQENKTGICCSPFADWVTAMTQLPD